jgi:hypothetical protein
MSTGAKKDDTGKVDLTMIPYSALIQEAKGFMLGKEKYGRDNYRQGLAVSRVGGAALRHLLAYLNGEDKDPDPKAAELGLETTHLGNARCCIAMLIEMTALGTVIDDRYRPTLIIPAGSGIQAGQLGPFGTMKTYGRTIP